MAASTRHHHSKPARRPMAFTLLELIVVVAVLVVLAGLVLPRFDNVRDTANQTGTQTTLNVVRDAILAYRSDMGGRLPSEFTLSDLYSKPAYASTYDPVSRRGWNGPYLIGEPEKNSVNPAPLDAWNNPIVLQVPSSITDSRLVSAGPDGVIQTPADVLYPTTMPANQRGDDMVLFLLRADTDDSASH